MHHHPHHSHERNAHLSRKLIVATIITALFVVIELAIGLWSRSLALVSDALHNFTDAVALVLALVAVRLELRPPTAAKSYGYQRAGVLAAFINASTVVGLTIFLFVEAWERLRNPPAVDSAAMFATALVAVGVNTGIMLAFRHDGRDDVNIRSAVVHMFGDALASVGVIIAAILIRTTGATQWDAAVSAIIGLLILWSSWGILRESVNLLLEGTPAGIDPDAVTKALHGMPGVLGVHHVHIWALGSSNSALSCHLMVGDVPVKSTSTLLEEINAMLAREYRIAHTTIQFEFSNCAEDDPYCVPYTARVSGQRTSRGT